MTSLQNLFVAKLPRNLTDADLEQIFVEYHPTSAKVMLDATTGKSKGFGFVLFESEDAGRKAYEKLNKTHVTLHGHNFNLCIFPSKHDGKVATEESNALYVRNIPLKLSQLEVEQFLRGFGPLTYCAMREDNFGGSVWVVYAEFDTVESAKSALMSLHGNRTYFNTSVAILAKYADSEEAKRERRRRREQQQAEHQQFETGHSAEPPANGGGRGGFAGHGSNGHHGGHHNTTHNHNGTPAPPPPLPMGPGSPSNSRTGSTMPHSYSTPEMHMEGSGAGLHPPSFASISHHFAPGRPGGVPPPPAMQQVTAPPMPQQQVAPSGPLPQQGVPMAGQLQQPPTPNSIGSFLNVTFNPNSANSVNTNFTHFGGLDQTPSRGSPGTPLNFSFGPDMEGSGALPNGLLAAGGSSTLLDATGHAPMTPVRRSSNLSTTSSYRHNPYAPVTPVSSGRNSSGPSTPVVSSIAYPTAPHVNMHFGASHHVHGSPVAPYLPPQGVNTANGHFASRGNNAFLAAPSGLNEAN